eukprot:scaffold66744_cov19-Prasinocladus_malaysianus.AAC.1
MSSSHQNCIATHGAETHLEHTFTSNRKTIELRAAGAKAIAKYVKSTEHAASRHVYAHSLRASSKAIVQENTANLHEDNKYR